MAKLPAVMCDLNKIFKEYAGKDGNATSMTKAELAELLRVEFGGAPSNKAEMEKFFASLDHDGDGSVSFQEFATFVAVLSVICCGDQN